MKKKLLIPILICLVLVVGVVCFILFGNNKAATTITLDINPSIEINLTDKSTVKSIVALNDDAKEVISNNLVGKSLDEALNYIAQKTVEKGYVDQEHIEIIIYSKGKISNDELDKKIRNSYEDKGLNPYIITIDNVTKEDEEFAKKHNISIGKASYINQVKKENENIDVEALIDKSVHELEETKSSGISCDKGYTLEGNSCLKEIERVAAINGEVCPNGYLDHDGTCYAETGVIDTDRLYCPSEFELIDNKCVRTERIDATPIKYTCPSGEESTRLKMGLTTANDGDANDIVCVDKSNAKHPVSPCETHDGTEYTVVGGKCYWHRAPVIASGCPGKIQVGGMCWDDASNILICEGYRDGKQYKSRDEYCEHSIKYIDPIVEEYGCPNEYTLDGQKCLKNESEDPRHERECPTGYTKTEDDRCINYNDVIEKTTGYYCERENSRLKGTECIIYDIVEANHN